MAILKKLVRLPVKESVEKKLTVHLSVIHLTIVQGLQNNQT